MNGRLDYPPQSIIVSRPKTKTTNRNITTGNNISTANVIGKSITNNGTRNIGRRKNQTRKDKSSSSLCVAGDEKREEREEERGVLESRAEIALGSNNLAQSNSTTISSGGDNLSVVGKWRKAESGERRGCSSEGSGEKTNSGGGSGGLLSIGKRQSKDTTIGKAKRSKKDGTDAFYSEATDWRSRIGTGHQQLKPQHQCSHHLQAPEVELRHHAISNDWRSRGINSQPSLTAKSDSVLNNSTNGGEGEGEREREKGREVAVAKYVKEKKSCLSAASSSVLASISRNDSTSATRASTNTSTITSTSTSSSSSGVNPAAVHLSKPLPPLKAAVSGCNGCLKTNAAMNGTAAISSANITAIRQPDQQQCLLDAEKAAVMPIRAMADNNNYYYSSEAGERPQGYGCGSAITATAATTLRAENRVPMLVVASCADIGIAMGGTWEEQEQNKQFRIANAAVLDAKSKSLVEEDDDMKNCKSCSKGGATDIDSDLQQQKVDDDGDDEEKEGDDSEGTSARSKQPTGGEQTEELSGLQTRSRTVGITTDPDELGLCEPGTNILLNGIIWHETKNGMLVLNVSWRGKTYVGSLVDATDHDWAPPKLRALNIKSNNGQPLNMVVGERRLRNGKVTYGGRTMKPPANHIPPQQQQQPIGSGEEPDKSYSNGANQQSRSCATNIDDDESMQEEKIPSGSYNGGMVECPRMNCFKKFRGLDGLGYHQRFAHRKVKEAKKGSRPKRAQNCWTGGASSDRDREVTSQGEISQTRSDVEQSRSYFHQNCASKSLNSLTSDCASKERI